MSTQTSQTSQNSQVAVNGSNGTAPARRALRTVAPPVDIYENAEEILVLADLPGVSGDAVDIRVENDTLTIATKHAPAPEPRALGREYEEFDFARTFRLPRRIDGANVRAESRAGTLVVRLPKAAATKPRKVAVVTTN